MSYTKKALALFLCLTIQICGKVEKKIALITGICGQDGSYLAEFLLDKNYEVHGISRDISVNSKNPNITYYEFDITDEKKMSELISTLQPDEIYNLAAQSRVAYSFSKSAETFKTNALSVYIIFDAIRAANLVQKTKVYQALSSEVFGSNPETPQTEKTIFKPLSPYAASKQAAYWAVKNERKTSGIFACSGILFNHESPRRPKDFVSKKIISTAVALKHHLRTEPLELGNLNAQRDWGYAKDYVESMWIMLQQDKPKDYVIATGETHSVREFVTQAFKGLDIELKWQGEGLQEVAYDKQTNEIMVRINPAFYRPIDTKVSVGDPSRARNKLGWEPKTTFNDLISIMLENELAALQKNKLLQ